MFCVIQEIKNKKPKRNGYYKELKAEYFSIIIGGKDCGHYTYEFCGDRFERPVRKSYKISIHHSYRENGKVKKKQYVICTVNYYDFAEKFFTLYDYCSSKIEMVAKKLNCSEEQLYDLISSKTDLLEAQILEEFQQTEEYHTHQEHKRIIAQYEENKKEFNQRYNLSGDEYDKIYDVFGTLRSPGKLKEIQDNYKARQQYEERSSYYKNFYSNYNDFFNNSFNHSTSNVDPAKKEEYRMIYKAAAKALHPDANPNRDTSAAMQVLNDLKNQWGI